MKIGILGTRGIPNHYGGFEQFAEHLSVGLVRLGHEVWVYNPHNHSFKEPRWHGVNLIHCFNPETYIGTPGQFLYDLKCIHDTRKRDFDVILQLGYTSSSVWNRCLPHKPKIATNMDGLEWKRSKYSKPVRWFLKYAENLAVKSSDLLIADSEVIQDYLANSYRVSPIYIPYGADIFNTPDPSILFPFDVRPKEYFLIISRMQSDNHLKEIIRGVLQSDAKIPLLIIGHIGSSYGKLLLKTYASEKIRFLGPIFEKKTLNNLRYYASFYFHGHSSGGTNPSLLEAMAASSPVCAHDNPFNREVLGADACFFSNSGQICEILKDFQNQNRQSEWILNNIRKIRIKYDWNKVIQAYERQLSS